jgi:hypothetical protein
MMGILQTLTAKDAKDAKEDQRRGRINAAPVNPNPQMWHTYHGRLSAFDFPWRPWRPWR